MTEQSGNQRFSLKENPFFDREESGWLAKETNTLIFNIPFVHFRSPQQQFFFHPGLGPNYSLLASAVKYGGNRRGGGEGKKGPFSVLCPHPEWWMGEKEAL